MPLYLLRRNEFDYDEYEAHLIRASCEQQARVICSGYDNPARRS